jgi:hypothetical protein
MPDPISEPPRPWLGVNVEEAHGRIFTEKSRHWEPGKALWAETTEEDINRKQGKIGQRRGEAEVG